MIATLIVLVAMALLLFAVARYISRYRKNSSVARIAMLSCILLALPPLGLVSYILYFSFFLPGETSSDEIYPGVQYLQRVFKEDNQYAVVHALRIDLSRAELRVSPPQVTLDRVQYVAKTTSQALVEYGADLAVNASFFSPFRDKHFLDYYPYTGDEVTPIGQTYSEGNLVGKYADGWPGLSISSSGRVDFDNVDLTALLSEEIPKSQKPLFYVSGRQYLIQDGIVVVENSEEAYPRLAAGLNAQKTEFWLFVVDGKQPGYSHGLGLVPLSHIMLGEGVYDAIELDGGGSATMVMKDDDGGARLLNRPSHTKIPNRERPVANHILIYAK